MNRRSFFRSLAATALVSFAANTRLAQASILPVEPDWSAAGQRYAEYLAASLRETEETLCANILNRSFST